MANKGEKYEENDSDRAFMNSLPKSFPVGHANPKNYTRNRMPKAPKGSPHHLALKAKITKGRSHYSGKEYTH